ncbi:MAG: hypothetical protein ACK5JS_07230 [Mangrovibacterium sp.]
MKTTKTNQMNTHKIKYFIIAICSLVLFSCNDNDSGSITNTQHDLRFEISAVGELEKFDILYAVTVVSTNDVSLPGINAEEVSDVLNTTSFSVDNHTVNTLEIVNPSAKAEALAISAYINTKDGIETGSITVTIEGYTDDDLIITETKKWDADSTNNFTMGLYPNGQGINL